MTDVLAPSVIRSMARGFSVFDLIKTAETMKASGQDASVELLYASWIQQNPDNPLLYAVLFNYSVVLSDLGKLQPAKECLERAIAINADFMPPYINMGRLYERTGAIGMAVVQWSAVLSKLPQINGGGITYKTTALNQIARTLESTNEEESAEDMLRQSLEIDPRQREVAQHWLSLRQRQCKWPVVSPWDRVDQKTLMAGMSPLSAAAYTDDPMLHLAMAWNYNLLDVGTPPQAMDQWPLVEQKPARLKIGYLCSDFREHALGHLLAEVLALHDRSAVEVHAYYCGPQASETDPLHGGFKETADHWVDVSLMDDAAAAQRIAADGIHILVDLNGYTREGRTKVIASRPAPVIVNWLGYPGTMGSPYHHYIVADEWIIPADSEKYYSEQVVRVPCYQPTNRKRKISDKVYTRADAGLPEDKVVYCCFNGSHKITRFTFDRWLTILGMVPDSVLWLLGSTEINDKRLIDYAAQRGISADRIIVAAKLPNPEHLARYPLADLFLDTTPYGAHTTASDALWMGVPVLTYSGRSFASRVCGSLLQAAGLPELVATTEDEFLDKAVELGRDRAAVQALRDRLKANRDSCTLFNPQILIAELEQHYRRMWQAHVDGTLPQPDLRNLDVYLDVGSSVKHEELEIQTLDDYEGWWREQLQKRHRFRPIPPDNRFFQG